MKTLIALLFGFGSVLSSFADSTNEPPKPPPMTTLIYKVDPETFMSHLKHLLPPRAGESIEKLFVRFIEQQHVEFPTLSTRYNDKEGKLVAMTRKSFVKWNDKTGMLEVVTTKAAHENIRVVVEKILNEPDAEQGKSTETRDDATVPRKPQARER